MDNSLSNTSCSLRTPLHMIDVRYPALEVPRVSRLDHVLHAIRVVALELPLMPFNDLFEYRMLAPHLNETILARCAGRRVNGHRHMIIDRFVTHSKSGNSSDVRDRLAAKPVPERPNDSCFPCCR